MATIYYRVKARNATGDSSPSNVSSVTVNDYPVDPPSNFGATPTAYNQINLDWGNVTSATKYKIYRSTSSGFTPGAGNKLASEPSESSFNDTTVAADTTYFYRVLAANASYDAPNYSIEISSAPLLDKPTSLSNNVDPGWCGSGEERLNFSWSNTNSTGHVRSETMTIQYYNGSSWITLSAAVTAGATSYQTGDMTGTGHTQWRIKYNTGSGAYATQFTDDTGCPG